MSYKVVLEEGKYSVTNTNGILEFERYNSPWDAASHLSHYGVVLALVQRVEELECELAAKENT